MLLEYARKIKEIISIKEWLDDLRYAKRNGLRATAKRVMRVFDAHHIPVTRIPQIFPDFNLKFSDFDNLDSIIKVLTPELLDGLSEHFFITRDWLDTGQGPIQEIYEHGYDFESLYTLINSYQNDDNDTLIAYFVIEDGVKFVPVEDHGTFENLIIILSHKVENDKYDFVYRRYQPLYFGYWHYYKTRMMIKSLSLLFFQSQGLILQKGFFSKRLKDTDLIKRFAVQIIEDTVSGYWYPDDFIFCNGKSAQEKDPVDATRMHEYLKQRNFYDKIKQRRTSAFLD